MPKRPGRLARRIPAIRRMPEKGPSWPVVRLSGQGIGYPSLAPRKRRLGRFWPCPRIRPRAGQGRPWAGQGRAKDVWEACPRNDCHDNDRPWQWLSSQVFI